MTKHKILRLVNISIAVLTSAFVFSCQENTAREVQIIRSESPIFAGGEYTLQAEFRKEGVLQEIAGVEYQSQRGKIEKGVYYAPQEPGSDTITMVYAPSRWEKKMEITILPAAPKRNMVEGQETVSQDVMAVETPAKNILPETQSPSSPEKKLASSDSPVVPEKPQADPAPESEQEKTSVAALPTPEPQEEKHQESDLRWIDTEGFKMQYPEHWAMESIDIGFRVKAPKTSPYPEAEITAAYFRGLDFLDNQTIKSFFRQQKGEGGKELEESAEEEMDLAGTKATKVVLETFSDNTKKAWWILAKANGAIYLFTFTGPTALFEGEKNIPDSMLKTLELKAPQLSSMASLQMNSQSMVCKHPTFEITFPLHWEIKQMGKHLTIASSDVHCQGKPAILFLVSYQQKEIQNLDLALILALFRQETIHDPSLNVVQEKDITLRHGLAKKVELEGGSSVQQKTWIIATKSRTTAYVMMLVSPLEIWQANPDFAEKILQSFTPRY